MILIGAVLGAKSGVLGMLLGGLMGHWFGSWIMGWRSAGKTQSVFTRAVFQSLGHLSKSDGRVTNEEIRAAEDLMAHLGLTGDKRQAAIRDFNWGKHPAFDLDPVLAEVRQATLMRQDLRVMFLDILLQVATADGRLNDAEREVLMKVARGLQIPASQFISMLHAHGAAGEAPYGAGAGRRSGGRSRQAPRPPSPPGELQQAYATLGVKASASDAEIKRAYRKLIARYHPDRLVSRGLPEEMMEMAKVRSRDINTAWDRIKEARKIN